MPNSDFVTIIHETDSVGQVINELVEVVLVKEQGPPGPVGPSAMTELADDTSPELGGDLVLGPYNIIGQLENTGFILDGGLL